MKTSGRLIPTRHTEAIVTETPENMTIEESAEVSIKNHMEVNSIDRRQAVTDLYHAIACVIADDILQGRAVPPTYLQRYSYLRGLYNDLDPNYE